ncbi:protein kinase [Acidobacteriota bacterium]
MRCPKCKHENPDDTRFCGNCAAPLKTSKAKSKSTSKTDTLQTPVNKLSTGTTFADRYQVIEELGKGGMGKVYKVFDTEIQEKIALKLLKPEIAADSQTIERFRNELKFARKIGHRNVCRMYDLNRIDGTYFITMEYVPGEDLKNFINRVGRLPIPKAVSIAEQVCEGLAEAHRQGVVHRDLKPQNIMIDWDGNARVMDFGIARFIKAKGITDAGIMIGTPEYLSPEQAETKDVDLRSDLYTLGIILYEMLTGVVPFDGETPLSVAMKHKTEKPKNPVEINPQIPEELSHLILKCMEKDRNKRYQRTEDLLSDLKTIRKSLPATETKSEQRRPVTSKEITVTVNLKKILIPALSFAVVGIIFISILLLRPPSATPVPTDKPSLAVMYFRNNTGDVNFEHWRTALADLLITDLSQSKYLRVLTAERLYNILQELEQLTATTYSTDVLREIGVRGGVQKVLVGNYTKAEDIIRISCTLLDAATGEMIATESVEGEGEASFYPMVDELTKRIKSNIKIPQKSIISDMDQQVGSITSSSPEALKLYSEGRKLHLAGDYTQSLAKMQEVLKFDPEFAMAYRSVAMSYHNMGYIPAKKNALRKAFELRDRVSERERYIIEGDYYRASEKTQDKAIETFQKILDVYPGDATASTNLAGLYIQIEKFDEALKLNQKRFEYGMGNLIGYSNLADSLLANGETEKAIQILDKYKLEYPKDVRLNGLLSIAYIIKGQYDRAQSVVEDSIAKDKKASPSTLLGDIFFLKGDITGAEQEYLKFPEGNQNRRVSLALLSLTQGKFQEAVEILEEKPAINNTLAYVYPKAGRFDEALPLYDTRISEALQNESISNHIQPLHLKGLVYLKKGDVVSAERIADELREVIVLGMNDRSIRYYHHLKGSIELEKENYSAAISQLSKAVDLLPYARDFRIYNHAVFMSTLAEAFNRAGDLDRAQETYEKLTALKLGRLRDGDLWAKSFYWLGKIHQEKGNRLEAIENFQIYLDLWQEADLGSAEVEDARRQIQSLVL